MTTSLESPRNAPRSYEFGLSPFVADSKGISQVNLGKSFFEVQLTQSLEASERLWPTPRPMTRKPRCAEASLFQTVAFGDTLEIEAVRMVLALPSLLPLGSLVTSLLCNGHDMLRILAYNFMQPNVCVYIYIYN